jgi:hypothetical protein
MKVWTIIINGTEDMIRRTLNDVFIIKIVVVNNWWDWIRIKVKLTGYW